MAAAELIDRAAPLFDAPLQCAAQGRPAEVLAVRLLPRSDGALHFEVCNDAADRLASLVLSPERFAIIKQDQSLRVDFDHFPAHLVALLRHCEQARYRMMVEWRDDHVGAAILEPTEFRDLCHLSLRLQLADDDAIRAHLWQRLRQEAKRSLALQAQLRDGATHIEELKEDVQKAVEECKAVKRAAEADRLEFASSVERRRTEALMAARLEVADEERARRDRAEARVLELEARQRAADDEIAQLKQTKAALEVTAMRESGANDAIGPLRAECAELRARCRELESRAFEEAARAARLQESVGGLEREMAAKEVATTRLAELLRAERLNSAALETKAEEARNRLADAEAGLGTKTALADRLQSQLQEAEAKLTRNNTVIRAQERTLKERTAELSQLNLKMADVVRLESTVEALSARLEDSLKTIEANKTVISYLNKELNSTWKSPVFRAPDYQSSSSLF